jgi:hypothetical protein
MNPRPAGWVSVGYATDWGAILVEEYDPLGCLTGVGYFGVSLNSHRRARGCVVWLAIRPEHLGWERKDTFRKLEGAVIVLSPNHRRLLVIGGQVGQPVPARLIEPALRRRLVDALGIELPRTGVVRVLVIPFEAGKWIQAELDRYGRQLLGEEPEPAGPQRPAFDDPTPELEPPKPTWVTPTAGE